MDLKDTPRVQTSFLSKPEKRILGWIAPRLPRWIVPDHLTAIGLAGAFISGAAYVLTNWGKGFFWLSSLGFIINWFGDSLDGTLARTRKIQRPKYGFYLDHNVDAITAFLCVTGAGLSPYLSFSAAMLILVGYYLLCIFTYINSYLRGSLTISYSGFGPTEFRLGIIIINTLFFFLSFENRDINLLGITLKLFDLFALGVAFVLLILYTNSFFKEKKYYEKEDPPRY